MFLFFFQFNIFLWWLMCSILGSIIVLQQVRWEQKASSSHRKLFHILAVIVFGTGLLYLPDLLYLASGVCFAIFIVLEVKQSNLPHLICQLSSPYSFYFLTNFYACASFSFRRQEFCKFLHFLIF